MSSVNRFILDIYGEAQNRSIEAFNAYVAKRLKELLNFDSGVFSTVGVESVQKYTLKSLYLDNQPIEKMRDRNYWETSAPDPMLLRAYSNLNKSVSAELKSLPDMSKAMLAYTRKYEVIHSLTFCSSPKPGEVEVASLWRAGGDCFSAADNALCDFLFPHMLQAQEINRRYHVEALRQTKIDFVSMISTLDGRLVLINDGAADILRLEWPDWQPPLLPVEMLEKMAGSRSMCFKGRQISIQAVIHEDFLCLKAKRTGPEDCLTARELECLALVRAGKTSTEMARTLNISERTVNFHVTNATHKLEADTRRHAVEKAAKLGLLPT